jgi:hypothetical protein
MQNINFYELGKNYILYYNEKNINRIDNLNKNSNLDSNLDSNLGSNLDSNLSSDLIRDLNRYLLNDKLLCEFLRGYIEMNSRLIKPDIYKLHNNELRFKIYFRKHEYYIIDYINKNWNIIFSINEQKILKNNVLFDYYIEFKFMNVLEILSKIYNLYNKSNINLSTNLNNNINRNLNYDDDLYNEYLNLCNFYSVNIDSDNIIYKLPRCKYKKYLKFAIIPYKDTISNIGYNISIICVKKNINENIYIYDTGIGIKPEYGYYFEVVPNNNLIKYGYIFANSNIIINPNDFNSIIITLIKIDPNLPEITLPFKCAYLILKKFIHFELSN